MNSLLDYNPNPFDTEGVWLKCGLHTHSTGSDGRLSPEELRDGYRGRGYHVLCITDHNVVTPVDGLSDENILVLPGDETNPVHPPPDRPSFHIVGINVSDPIPGHALNASMIVRRINEQGGVAVLGHPAWGGHHMDEILGVEGYAGIEVYNRIADKAAKGYSDQIWNHILDLRGLVWGLAVDDAHGEKSLFGGWVWLKASARSSEAVSNALRRGDFYASQGPRILDFGMSLSSETSANGTERPVWKVTAKTTPAKTIYIIANGDHGGWTQAPENGTVSCAEKVLSKYARWVRLEVVGHDGKKAWSNPLLVPPFPEKF